MKIILTTVCCSLESMMHLHTCMHIIGISSIHALGAAKGPSTFQTYPCGGRGKARSPNNVQNSRVAACQMFLIV